MAWCAAVNCQSRSKKNPELTFCPLTKDKKTADKWIAKIRRKDKLPKNVNLCENHFKDDCFDKSVDLRRRLDGKSLSS